MAHVIATVLPRFDHNVSGEVLQFLEPKTGNARFAHYHDRHGNPYRRGERHRCWTILHPRPDQPQSAVLLDSGIFGYVDPPDGIERPDDRTYLSRKPLRRWDLGTDFPAEDLMRNYLEGALTRYLNFGA
jgi:hypothetical protein